MGSFLAEAPSIYIVETLEATTLLSITSRTWKNYMKAGIALNAWAARFLTSLLMQKEKQEYDKIRLTIRERFMQFMRNNPDLLQRVPQKYLASYLNIKPETFSRIEAPDAKEN